MKRMMTMRFVAITMTAIALAGCAGGPVPIKTPYSVEEHDPFRVEGKNTVTGQAFLRQVGGGTVSCAGTTAVLFPDTPFFKEVVDIASRGQKPDASAMPTPNRDRSSHRSAFCDAQGNFTMEAVPAGRWILVAEVRWKTGPYTPQGGTLKRSVQVKDGATNRFILSDSDLYRAS